MHVLLEGVVRRELELLLKEYIHSNYFNINQLNERITCFDFSPEESRNKPTPITQDVAVHESGDYTMSCHASLTSYMHNYVFYHYTLANQMWKLVVYCPLIIGNKVPLDDDLWEYFQLLLDILQVCTILLLSAFHNH